MNRDQELDNHVVAENKEDSLLISQFRQNIEDDSPQSFPDFSNDSDLYKCSICDESFSDLSALQSHVEKGHTEGELYQCNFCESTFSNYDSFQCHMLVHEEESPRQNSSDLEEQEELHTDEQESLTNTDVSTGSAHQNDLTTKVTIQANESERPFQCSVCKRTYTCQAHLLGHITVHERNTSHGSSSVDLTTENPVIKKRNSVCGKQLSKESDLSNNANVHTDEQPHKCSTCGKTFKSNSQLQEHTRRTHNGNAPFKCSLCQKEFLQKANLHRHMEIHTSSTNQTSFKCPTCGKEFSRKVYLRRHVKIHSDVKPFVCSVCGEGFVRMIRLQTHLLSHTGERPFECSVCSKTFLCKSYLREHMRGHNGDRPKNFVCSVCGKACTRRTELEIHMRSHTGERPFECSLCDKAFPDKSGLLRHIRSHMGEKSFVCDVCGKGFTKSMFLRRHTEKEHSTNTM